MTEYLDINGGRIAYESIGEGPLVVLQHGMGVTRQTFRHLAPLLAREGYRVVSADMRGHGESSMGWESITRTDVASDLVALIRHLGGPAVIVGHSLAGGAATIAAATAPELVSAVVEIGPFTKKQSLSVGGLVTNSRYRRGMLRLMGTGMFKSLKLWQSYLDVAYPSKPADWDSYLAGLTAKLSEPGRFAEFLKSTKSTPADAHAKLAEVQAPVLVVMGGSEPDFADPRAEAEAIAALLRPGLATIRLIEGAGHYPHDQYPEATATAMLDFLKEHAVA